MSRVKKHVNGRQDVPLPRLGALLRLCHQELINEVTRHLQAEGMGDLRPAQFAVCQQLAAHPEGLRLTDLAAYAGITKPSMSALVAGLERSGYVERAVDAQDQRAQLVRFTERGRDASQSALRAVLRVERGWAERVGAREIDTVRRILRALVDSRPPSRS
jgi:DNA-binding MarR family transcriptional regulator